LGFAGSLLTDKECDYLLEHMTWSDTNKIAVNLVSFTEDFEGRDWATVVIKDCGAIGNSGKMATYREIQKLASKEVIIDLPTKELILNELTKANLQHLIDEVTLIIFSTNY
jgi:hypothetical protein